MVQLAAVLTVVDAGRHSDLRAAAFPSDSGTRDISSRRVAAERRGNGAGVVLWENRFQRL